MKINDYFITGKEEGETFLEFKLKRRSNGVRCVANLYIDQNLLVVENKRYDLNNECDLIAIQRTFHKKVIALKGELKLYPYDVIHYLERMKQIEKFERKIAFL